MRRSYAVFALSLSLFASCSRATTGEAATPPAPKPEDFVAGFDLVGQAGLAVQTLLLPIEVYRGADAQLSELSVFDGEGKPVAWALRAAPELSVSERQVRDLAAFPIYGQASEQAASVRLALARSRDGGSVLDIHALGPAGPSREGKLLAYILDTKQPAEPLSALEFALSDTQPNTLFALDVESSDDLSSWQPLVRGATLGQLNHQGQAVVRTRIALPSTRAAFLRLSWSGDVPFAFTHVSGESERVRTEHTRALRHLELGPVALRDGAYELDLGAVLSVFSVAAILPDEQVLLKVVLEVGELGAERTLFTGQIYRLEHASQALTSPAIQLAAERGRKFRLRVDTRAAEPPRRPLGFAVAYAPQQLLYVAHGAAPHLLAFGSYRRDGAAYDAEQLIAFLTPEQRAALPLESARAIKQRSLGGEAARRAPAAPVPMRTVVLWSVLVAGAALLILLAFALLRKSEKR